MPDGRVKREGLKPQRLLWGLPLDLHVSFHCLAWGPEGDLYLNHGDPLLELRRLDPARSLGPLDAVRRGRKARRCRTPAAARCCACSPTAASLQVVAGGLRGPVGLAFDRDWNLFTNDNDHESRADLYAPARLLHVTPHADFAWPRGWMASKSPDRADLLEPMIADLGRGVPCDLAYYDEPFFPASSATTCCMCRWDRLGGDAVPAASRAARASRPRKRAFLDGTNNARPVGRRGRPRRPGLRDQPLPGRQRGVAALCQRPGDDHARRRLAGRIPSSRTTSSTVPAEQLWAELSHPSWERRSRAHQEILRRGGELLDEATPAAGRREGRRSAPCCICPGWPAASGSDGAPACSSEAGRPHSAPTCGCRRSASWPSSRVLALPATLFVAGAGRRRARVATGRACRLRFKSSGHCRSRRSFGWPRSTDTYLRQTATRLLARCATVDTIGASLLR